MKLSSFHVFFFFLYLCCAAVRYLLGVKIIMIGKRGNNICGYNSKQFSFVFITHREMWRAEAQQKKNVKLIKLFCFGFNFSNRYVEGIIFSILFTSVHIDFAFNYIFD